MLSKSDFESALNKYQDVADQIKVVALQRATLSVLTDMVVSESLAKGKTKDETIESILEVCITLIIILKLFLFCRRPKLQLPPVSEAVQFGVD